MKRKQIGQISMTDEIIVDLFAGGGGASTGIEIATGRVVNVAVNHNPEAIRLHQTNHKFTEHYQEDIWKVDPEKDGDRKLVCLRKRENRKARTVKPFQP